jgi:hypothetical protein
MRWARSDNPETARLTDISQENIRQKNQRDQRPEPIQVPQQDQRDREYDIVEHALRLVARMSADERERFEATFIALPCAPCREHVARSRRWRWAIIENIRESFATCAT